MRKSIVFKWFLLTATLFIVVLLLIGIVQNYYFEQYYLNKKTDDLRMYTKEYEAILKSYGAEDASRVLYTTEHVWITKLDAFGRISDVEDYYIEVELISGAPRSIWQIPMYGFEGAFSSDVLTSLRVGDEVVIDAINIAGEKIPYLIHTDSSGVVNLTIANKLHGPHADESYSHLRTGLYRGNVTKTVFPEHVESIPFPYLERFFLEPVKEFQLNLLADVAKPLELL